MKRISASLVLLFSILYMPFWVSVLLTLGAMLHFRLFLEGVMLFFLSDLLYGAHEVRFFGITYISLIVSTLVLIGLELLKRKLKFYV